jgi:hypothetical protein
MSARPSLAQQWQANAHQAIDSERAAHNLLQIIEAHRDYRRLWMKSARDARGFLVAAHVRGASPAVQSPGDPRAKAAA